MPPKRLNRPLPPLAAASLIGVAAALVGGFEWTALRAKEARDYPVQNLNWAYCTRCHSDAFMIERMKYKEGACSFIFHDTKQRVRPDLAGIAPPGSALGRRRHPSVTNLPPSKR
jgi:hypothetical protein